MPLWNICNQDNALWVMLHAIYHSTLYIIKIVTNMVEDCIEVFMDDFLVVGDSLENCLNHLDMVLKTCED